MKYVLILFSSFFLFACASKKVAEQNKRDEIAKENALSVSQSSKKEHASKSEVVAGESLFNSIVHMYIVVADTGLNYNALNNRMRELSVSLQLPIDTLGRSYDSKKDLICLSKDDKDEQYAGKYIPRRYPAENLSLEYFLYYFEKSNPKTIAIVMGIYESEGAANAALLNLKKYQINAFKVKSKIDLGCMH
jgi:hypothetical protein